MRRTCCCCSHEKGFFYYSMRKSIEISFIIVYHYSFFYLSCSNFPFKNSPSFLVSRGNILNIVQRISLMSAIKTSPQYSVWKTVLRGLFLILASMLSPIQPSSFSVPRLAKFREEAKLEASSATAASSGNFQLRSCSVSAYPDTLLARLEVP